MSNHKTLCEAEKQMELLLAASGKYQKQLVKAIQEGDTGWHRLNVKLLKGGISKIQLLRDTEINLDDE